MLDLSTILIFSAAALLLSITPGPDMLYIIARSVGQGRGAGLVSILGIYTGVVVHIAVLGLSALLASSALAFSVVKYLGAAYLIYLGVRTLMGSREEVGKLELSRATSYKIFYQGMITNVLNPKIALFFLAFLPQFVNPESGAVGTQILLLGLLFVVNGALVDVAVALLAGALGNWLKAKTVFWQAQRWFTGTVFIALGIGTAFADTRKS